jgi:hypothetical protein
MMGISIHMARASGAADTTEKAKELVVLLARGQERAKQNLKKVMDAGQGRAERNLRRVMKAGLGRARRNLERVGCPGYL